MDCLTALEIATNPRDLCIIVAPPQDAKNDRCVILISRGKGHDYKPLLSSNSPVPRENAVMAVITTLQAAKQHTSTTLTDGSFVSEVINPDKISYDESSGLSDQDIQKIQKALEEGVQTITTAELLAD